jgi:hypothetical protein
MEKELTMVEVENMNDEQLGNVILNDIPWDSCGMKEYREGNDIVTVECMTLGFDGSDVANVHAKIERCNMLNEMYNEVFKDLLEPEYGDGVDMDALKEVLYEMRYVVSEYEQRFEILVDMLKDKETTIDEVRDFIGDM